MKRYLFNVEYSKKKELNFWISVFLSCLVALVTFWMFPYGITPDSEGFLRGISERAFLYPVFIHINRILFGEKALLFAVTIEETILCIVGVMYLTAQLWKLPMVESTWSKVAMTIVVWIPWVNMYLEDKIWTPKAIMSEALSYPLFYFLIGVGIKIIINNKVTNVDLGIILLWATLAGLTRKQLVMIYPGIFLLVILYSQKTKKIIISTILGILISLCVIVCSRILYDDIIFQNEKAITGYDSMKYSVAMYFSKDTDVNLIESEDGKILWEYIYNNHRMNGFNYYENSQTARGFELEKVYRSGYNRAWSSLVYDDFITYYEREKGLDREQAVEKIKSELNVVRYTVLFNNFKAFLKLYLIEVINCLAATAIREQYAGFEVYFAAIVFGVLASLAFYNRKKTNIKWLTCIVLSIVLVNSAGIAFYTFGLVRYTYYVTLCLYLLLIAHVNEVIRDRKNLK